MASEKLCTICQNKNVDTASVCSYCGAALEGNETKLLTASEHTGGKSIVTAEDVAAFIDIALIPDGGVGIHIAGTLKPYYVAVYKELILGRQAEATLESVLDLSDLDAFAMGVSRRHVMIRQTESGFEAIDLSSRNGTWLNAEKLVPNKPYPFASGSQLRLGRMRLFIAYHVVAKDAQKK